MVGNCYVWKLVIYTPQAIQDVTSVDDVWIPCAHRGGKDGNAVYSQLFGNKKGDLKNSHAHRCFDIMAMSRNTAKDLNVKIFPFLIDPGWCVHGMLASTTLAISCTCLRDIKCSFLHIVVAERLMIAWNCWLWLDTGNLISACVYNIYIYN